MLKTGKLPHSLLERALALLGGYGHDVLAGPEVGLDSAIIKLGEKDYLVVSSDPITFTANDIGFYLVAINANDIAVTGARPRYMVVDLLLPEGKTDEDYVLRLFNQIKKAATELGIAVVGGHTEITYNLDRTIAVGTMLGRIQGREPITSAGMQEGDLIILTQPIAIEGTATIAREKEIELSSKFGKEFVSEAANLLYNPGISIVDDALTASGIEGTHAMHDPTEGGLATALHEMAMASDKGILVHEGAIPVLEATQRICHLYGIDPLGLLASGTLLISASPDGADKIIDAIRRRGSKAKVIGEVKDRDFGVKIERNGRISDLPIFSQDEITKVI